MDIDKQLRYIHASLEAVVEVLDLYNGDLPQSAKDLTMRAMVLISDIHDNRPSSPEDLDALFTRSQDLTEELHRLKAKHG